jgi:hypothetical protein
MDTNTFYYRIYFRSLNLKDWLKYLHFFLIFFCLAFACYRLDSLVLWSVAMLSTSVLSRAVEKLYSGIYFYLLNIGKLLFFKLLGSVNIITFSVFVLLTLFIKLNLIWALNIFLAFMFLHSLFYFAYTWSYRSKKAYLIFMGLLFFLSIFLLIIPINLGITNPIILGNPTNPKLLTVLKLIDNWFFQRELHFLGVLSLFTPLSIWLSIRGIWEAGLTYPFPSSELLNYQRKN